MKKMKSLKQRSLVALTVFAALGWLSSPALSFFAGQANDFPVQTTNAASATMTPPPPASPTVSPTMMPTVSPTTSPTASPTTSPSPTPR